MVSSAAPYIDLVPKDPIENLKWRERWRKAAMTDRSLQKDFKQAAFEDPLLFFNAFAWVFEPRPTPRVLPFITWPHQDPCILVMEECLGREDFLLEKSRAQGATWMYLIVFLRRWLRDPMFAAGLVCRTEKQADSKMDPDSLMWKLDWSIKMLPPWMRPKGFDPRQHRNYSDHVLYNPETEATITGYAATQDVGRGGRKTVFAMDELAFFDQAKGDDYQALSSTQQVALSRFLVSTYNGDSGAYYDAAQDPDTRKFVLRWEENPTQNQGAYRAGEGGIFRTDGTLLVGDELRETRERLAKLRRRGYVVENTLRSPWYDRECLRPAATPRLIARELDRNPHGSVSKVFDMEVLEQARKCCCRPIKEGRLAYDSDTCEPKGFIESAGGELKLWIPLDIHDRPPRESYVVSADVAAGTGGGYSSNSTIFVANRRTGEQVASYAFYKIRPPQFAHLCVSVCRWFHDAYLIWDATGATGAVFTNELMDNHLYNSVYFQTIGVEGLHRKTNRPGFMLPNDDAKLKLLDGLNFALAESRLTIRDENAIEEAKGYVWDNGKIVYKPSVLADDDAAKGRAHGDRAIGAAICWAAMKDQPMESDRQTPTVVPDGSYASRQLEHRRRRDRLRDPWDWDGEGVDRPGNLRFPVGKLILDPWN